jgi:hypothetical protein
VSSLLPAVIWALGVATPPPKFALTIANMMRGPEHCGCDPPNVRRSPGGQRRYVNWLPAGSGWRDATKPYRVRAQEGANPELVSAAERDRLAPVLAPGPTVGDRLGALQPSGTPARSPIFRRTTPSRSTGDIANGI